MSKKDNLEKNRKKIEKLLAQGFEEETEIQLNRLYEEQMEILKTLSVDDPEELELMKQIIEINKQTIAEIQKNSAALIEQSSKITDSRDNKKNYDLYR